MKTTRPRHYLLPAGLMLGALVSFPPVVDIIHARYTSTGNVAWFGLLGIPVLLAFTGLGIAARVNTIAHRRSLRHQRHVWATHQEQTTPRPKNATAGDMARVLAARNGADPWAERDARRHGYPSGPEHTGREER